MVRRKILPLVVILASALQGCSATNLGQGLRNPLPLSASKPKKRATGARLVHRQNSLLANFRNSRSPPVRRTLVKGTGEFLGSPKVVVEAKTHAGKDGVRLNLVNVSITQAAKAVLGDLLKVNYSVDPKIRGRITLQTSRPIPKAAIVMAFENALRAKGATIVQSGGSYRISASTARHSTVVTRGIRKNQLGLQTLVLPLRYISASEAKRLIEAVASKGAVVDSDNTRNIIMISGTASELQHLTRLIDMFDVDWMKGMSFGLIPLKASDPEKIAKELKALFGTHKGGPLKGVVRFIPNRRLGSVLIVTSNPAYLDKAKTWVARLDRLAHQNEVRLFVYKVHNRSAAELATLLEGVLRTDARTTRTPQPSQIVAPRFTQETTTSRRFGGRSLTPFTPSTPTNNSAQSPIVGAQTGKPRAITAGGARVVADTGQNSLLIYTSPKMYTRIRGILERLDVLPTQVLLEAVIAEVSLNDDLKFGLKWFLEKRRHQITFTDAVNGAVASAFPGFSYFFQASNVQAALDAVSGVTKVNVVSAPSLMVMDNKKATLQIGDQVPIVTQTAQGVTNPDAPIINAITLKDTGVILSVTPRVNASGRVILQIEQEVSSVAETTTSGIDSPTIQQRRVRTTVVVSDGQTLALGGLIQNRKSTVTTQVPFLGNIPVVGSAFRNKSDKKERTELVIFIRPQVVRDRVEAKFVTDEFKQRLKENPIAKTPGKNVYEKTFNRVIR